MAHNSNSHDAPWLPNYQTEMFSVYAGNARSSSLVVGAVANCSTHASGHCSTHAAGSPRACRMCGTVCVCVCVLAMHVYTFVCVMCLVLLLYGHTNVQEQRTWHCTVVSGTTHPCCRRVRLTPIRSTSTSHLVVLSFKVSTIGISDFPVATAKIWNALLDNVI